MMETAAIPSSPVKESAVRLNTMVVTAIASWLTNSDAFEIVSSEVQDEQTVNYKLRKLTAISNSELLSLVGAQGEICKFTECIPSMNDIFIRTVEGKI